MKNQNLSQNSPKKRGWVILLLGNFCLLGIILLLIYRLEQKKELELFTMLKTRNAHYFLAKILRKNEMVFSIFRYSSIEKKFKTARKNLLKKALKEDVLISNIKSITLLKINLDDLLQKKNEEAQTRQTNKTGLPPKKYLGIYKITVLGHKGALKLQIRNNRLIGRLRFPKWGKGAWEICKNIYIRKNRLYFIRSVETTKERRRIGSPRFFKQVYRANFIEKGRKIVGTYKSSKAQTPWKGEKL